MKISLSPRRTQRGAVLPMAAAAVVIAMIASALAVDIGLLAQDRRRNQKVADLAALDAVRALPADPTSAARASATRNGFTWSAAGYSLTAEPLNDAGAVVLPSAATKVRVTAKSPRKPVFPFVGNSERIITAHGVALLSSEAEFSVGSTLVALDTQKSFLDPILGSMLGLGALSLNGVSYQGLASGNVTLRALQTQLVALGADVGTADKLLNNSITVADLLRASAQALTNQGNFVAAAEVNDIPINLIPNIKTVKLGQLVSLSQPGSNSALDTSLNVFNLLSGSAQVANGTSFVNVPGINCTGITPLLGSCGVSLRVIEPAQRARGKVGVQAKTSQVVLRIQLNLAPIGINTVSGLVDFTAGSATGTLTDIRCTGATGITVGANTSGATISGVFGVSVPIIGPLLGSLTANGTVTPAAAGTAVFNYPTQFLPPVGASPAYSQHVGVANLGLSPSTLTMGGTGAAGLVAGVVQPVLSIVLQTLDTALIPTLAPVLRSLGLDMAAADISAVDIYPAPPSCGQPSLVE